MKKLFMGIILSAALSVLSAPVFAATAVYFNHFEELAHEGGVNLGTDTFYLVLSNGAPSATWTDNSEITSEVANGNGYTTGGNAMTVVSSSQTGGTYTWVGSDVSWTLTGEVSFRYAILNDTTTDNLVCYWDFGSTQVASTSITINITTLLTVSFACIDGVEYWKFQFDGPRLWRAMEADTRIFRNVA